MKRIAFLFLFGISSFSVSVGQKINFDTLEIFIHKLMSDFDVPGMAIGIIRNDSVLFCKGYGVREINKPSLVDENTLFGVGSISKSFTALTLAMLVDEGKLNWDDKVVRYLPYFKLYDPYVTANFTVRDLLTHRSGLREESGGMLIYHSDFSRTEIIRKFQYLRPVSDFRYVPAYQNIMFIAASEIVKEIAGKSWDQYLKTKVFDRIEMPASTSVYDIRESSKNISQPHVFNDDFKRTAIKQEIGDNSAPAGFVFSSAREMINYMRLLLNHGIFGNDTIIHSRTLSELFKPQIHFPLYPYHNEFTSYGFGWWLTPKNGHKIIEHSGGIDGSTANLIMVEDMKLGIVAFCNARERAPLVLTSKILEIILHDPSFDIYSIAKTARDKNINATKQLKEDLEKERIKDTKPSYPLEHYAGTYNDKMYGDIFINKLNNEELYIEFSHSKIFQGQLKHWQYDTFKIDWNDIRIPDGFLTFNFNSKGDITGFSLDQARLLDVDFNELSIVKQR